MEDNIGLNMELLYSIKIIEESIKDYSFVQIMHNIWYQKYNYSNRIVNDKCDIYKSIAKSIRDNKPDNVDELITAVEHLFEYLDSTILINKLLNADNYAEDSYKYNINLLKNPEAALQDLSFQLMCMAC